MSLFLALVLTTQDPHPLKHRILSTWDTWISEDDPAGKSFLAETKDLIDWMSKHEYTALVVWGFVDPRHGGEAAAKDLARYARTKGLTLLPGVSAPAQICYAKAENRESLRASMEALLEAYDVDGVHLETEAGLACGCAEHLSICAPIVADVCRARRKEPLVTYGAGKPLWWERSKESNDLLKLIPEAGIARWSLELAVNDAPSPVKHNLGQLTGGGWSYPPRRLAPERGPAGPSRCFYPKLDDIRVFAGNARKMGLDGFVAGRGGSAKNPDAELAYLAFIDFTRDPALTLEAFFKKHVPRLFGEAAAEEVVKLLLAQPAAHEAAAPYWRAYDGRWPEGNAKEAAAALAAQLALAKSAAMKASADGKRRLDAIIPILDEYRVICEAAAAGISDKAKLAEAYEKAGLPDDLYGYKKWK